MSFVTRIIISGCRSYCKVCAFCTVLKKTGICRHIFVKIRTINKISIQISPLGINLLNAGRMQTDTRKLIVGFNNCFGKV